MINAVAGLGLVALLALPWTRQWLESVMILHMLVQIPLLAGAGALMVIDLPATWRARLASWNRNGVSGILMAVAASSWWMAPRALDAALASPAMELAKFVSLPLFVGVPLALSWSWLDGDPNALAAPLSSSDAAFSATFDLVPQFGPWDWFD